MTSRGSEGSKIWCSEIGAGAKDVPDCFGVVVSGGLADIEQFVRKEIVFGLFDE